MYEMFANLNSFIYQPPFYTEHNSEVQFRQVSLYFYCMFICKSLYHQLFVGGRMSHLHYLCLFVYSGVNTFCVLFLFCFLRLVVSVTSFSGLSFYDCPFMIAPTVFFNVYLLIGMTGFA